VLIGGLGEVPVYKLQKDRPDLEVALVHVGSAGRKTCVPGHLAQRHKHLPVQTKSRQLDRTQIATVAVTASVTTKRCTHTQHGLNSTT